MNPIQMYEEALLTSSEVAGSIILRRHPIDMYTSNFNLEWLFVWDRSEERRVGKECRFWWSPCH